MTGNDDRQQSEPEPVADRESDNAAADTETAAGPRFRTFQIGALIAVLGGLLVTAANISEIASWFVPDETREVLEETRSTIATTDAKVDELMQLLRQQAAASGVNIDAASQRTIQDAIRTIVESGDQQKAAALRLLESGDSDAAAVEIAKVAAEQSRATTQTMEAAAASWRQAGAIFYTTNIAEAVRSYEAAYELRPRDPLNAKELGFTYIRAGRLNDADEKFREALSLDPEVTLQSDLHRGLGVSLQRRGDYEPSKEHLFRAIDLAEQVGDRRRRTMALLVLANIARLQGDVDHAREQFELSVELAEESGDDVLLASALNALGIAMSESAEYDDAEVTLRRALAIQDQLGDLAGRVTSYGNLGANALKSGDIDAAERYLVESVALGERLGWQQSIAIDSINLGGIAQSRGEYDAALRYLERALQIAADIGLEEFTPIIYVNMGEVERDRGNDRQACEYWAQSMPALREMNHAAVAIVTDYQAALNCPVMPDAADP
ncbi:MAG: tetratricopeptide repeat protein [Woeseiaceae bacterium]|nr:tetratricopeptide repeat protein [Woeseiaceae bacterium]